jgi:hypothetical protein
MSDKSIPRRLPPTLRDLQRVAETPKPKHRRWSRRSRVARSGSFSTKWGLTACKRTSLQW